MIVDLLVDVEWSDSLWEGEVLCNSARNANLVNVEVGVRGYDCPGGVVHPLPHQVPTDVTLLGF